MADCRCGSKYCTICNPELEIAGELIPIELDIKTYNSLLGMFVEQTLSKESRTVYKDYLAEGVGEKQALSHAVINEMVVRSLIDKIEREKFAKVLRETVKEE